MPDEKRLIDIARIYVPDRFRKHSPESIAKMAEELKQTGQLHDITVTPIPDGAGSNELLAGDLRLEGAKQAGWTQISCLVKENVSDYDKVMIMIKENVRDGVDPIDEGRSYIVAMKAGKKSQEELAKDLGVTQKCVSQYVAIAGLPEEVIKIIPRGIIDVTHLFQITRLGNPEAQKVMIEHCVKEGFTVKQLENLVNKALSASPDPAGQAEAVKQAAGSAPKPKTRPGRAKGIRIAKAGKGVHIVWDTQTVLPVADFSKIATEAYQKWFDEQAQLEQATPNPTAQKAAKAFDKARKDDIAKAKKAIKLAEEGARKAEKAGLDSSGIRQQIQAKKDKLKELMAKPISSLNPEQLAQLKKLKEGGQAAVESGFEAQVAQLKKALGSPDLTDAQKTGINMSIQKLQSQLDAMKKNGLQPQPDNSVTQTPTTGTDNSEVASPPVRKDNPETVLAGEAACPPACSGVKQSDLPDGPASGQHATAAFGDFSALDSEIARLEMESADPTKTEEERASKRGELEKSKANLADIKKFLGL